MYYENFRKLCELNNVKPGTVSRETGISTATLSSWKQDKYTPKPDKLQKIADYFNVSLDFLMKGEDSEMYYINQETAEIAQKIFDNPDLKVLFDAAQGVSPENIKLAAQMLERMKESNPDG